MTRSLGKRRHEILAYGMAFLDASMKLMKPRTKQEIEKATAMSTAAANKALAMRLPEKHPVENGVVNPPNRSDKKQNVKSLSRAQQRALRRGTAKVVTETEGVVTEKPAWEDRASVREGDPR